MPLISGISPASFFYPQQQITKTSLQHSINAEGYYKALSTLNKRKNPISDLLIATELLTVTIRFQMMHLSTEGRARAGDTNPN